MKHVILFVLLLCIGQVKAMHILGGYMSYSCEAVPNSGMVKVSIQMTLYRDCTGGGAPFDNPAPLAVYKAGVVYQNLSVISPAISVVNIVSPACPDLALNLCVEKAVYNTSFQVPSNSAQPYTVAYQRCCRSVVSSNLLQPTDQGHTIAIDITPAAIQALNRSPQWASPQFVTCVTNPDTLDLSASEPDGDVLRYRFASPLQGGGPLLYPPSELFSCTGATPNPPCPPPFDSVVFLTPNYQSWYPLGWVQSGTLDSLTGLWAFTATLLGGYTYGVQVEEYRNGQLLSRSLHDIALFVFDDFSSASGPTQSYGLKLSPNPVKDWLYVTLEEWSGPIRLAVYDMQGRRCLQMETSPERGKVEIPVGLLPAGRYLITAENGQHSLSGYFVR